jgi:hypothetical protein
MSSDTIEICVLLRHYLKKVFLREVQLMHPTKLKEKELLERRLQQNGSNTLMTEISILKTSLIQDTWQQVERKVTCFVATRQ